MRSRVEVLNLIEWDFSQTDEAADYRALTIAEVLGETCTVTGIAVDTGKAASSYYVVKTDAGHVCGCLAAVCIVDTAALERFYHSLAEV